MLLEELVARFGPAGPIDVGDRPDSHRPEHAVLLDDGLPAAVDKRPSPPGKRSSAGARSEMSPGAQEKNSK